MKGLRAKALAVVLLASAAGLGLVLRLGAEGPGSLEPSSELAEVAVEDGGSSAQARTEMLSYADELQLKEPFLPPKDLYVFWGKSSFKGHGPLGRASSGERVRQILRLGTFTGNEYIPSVHGHGKMLYTWTGQTFQELARTCCSTVLVPPMEDDLPLYWDSDTVARNIRNFVSNGNRLVLTGGSFTSLVFLNRYFHFDLKKEIFDAGPFDRRPARSGSSKYKSQLNQLPAELPQSGLAVTSVQLDSLPPNTNIIYSSATSSPMFEITFCEKVLRGLRGHWCAKHAGHACQVDATPQECKAEKAKGRPCSCGTILYDGFDFIDNHKTWIGASVWDKTIRASTTLQKLGTPGKATWPCEAPPPPPPPPPSQWTIRMWSGWYNMYRVPDIQYLQYEDTDVFDGYINFYGRSSMAKYVKLPATNYAGVIYGRMHVEIPGFYTFCSRSRDGSRLYIDNDRVVNNDGRHHTMTKCAVKELHEGLHDVVVDFFSRHGHTRLRVTYSGPDTDDERKLLNSWSPQAPPPPSDSRWRMRVFKTDREVKTIERVSGLNFVGETVVPWLTMTSLGDFRRAIGATPAINFVYQFFGRFRADDYGWHKMCVASDEMSRLFVDGDLLVTQMIGQGWENCEDIYLNPGEYKIKIDGYQGGGGVSVWASYESPGTNGNRQRLYSTSPSAPPIPPQSRMTMRIYKTWWNIPDIPSVFNTEYVGTSHNVKVIDFVNQDWFRRAVGGTPNDNFVWDIYGSILIMQPGTYTICLWSDDGSRVWIDQGLLIDDGGLHGKRQVCQNTYMGPGSHSMRVKGFDSLGAAYLKLEYSGPDTYDLMVPVVSNGNQWELEPRPGKSEWKFKAFHVFPGLSNMPNLNVASLAAEGKVEKIDFPDNGAFKAALPGFPGDFTGWRFTGKIYIGIAGSYEFCSISDDGSYLWVNEQLLVNNDGLHGMEKRCGTVSLGEGPQFVRCEGWNNEGGAGQIVTYKGPDTGGEEVHPKSFDADNEPSSYEAAPGAATEAPAGGWKFTAHSIPPGTGNLPDLNNAPVVAEGTVDEINLGNNDAFKAALPGFPGDYTGWRFTGKVLIDNGGSYEFCTNSDDGSKLWVDGQQVVDNDGLHGMENKCGSLNLNPGGHFVQIDGFNNEGGAGEIVTYSGPDTGGSAVFPKSYAPG